MAAQTPARLTPNWSGLAPPRSEAALH